MIVNAIRTRVFEEREDLAEFIIKHIPTLKEGSVLAVASKIVALAEGRVVDIHGKKAKEELIRAESEWALKVLPTWWLTIRDGSIGVNAGIDESNAKRGMILLPKDSFVSAALLRKQLMKHFSVRQCGIIITDSRIMPLRAGVAGVALGYAGFKGVYDYRGKKDIFGRTMEVTQINIADSLATAATFVMGEGSEQQPLSIIEDPPVQFVSSVDPSEVRMDRKHDMYRHLFALGSKRSSRRKK